MKRHKWAVVGVLSAWAIGGVVVIACGDEAPTITNPPDAGEDHTVPTSTATTPVPPTDSGHPSDSGNPASDSGDLDAGARAIWAFNNYCGDAYDAGNDASCPSFDDCPSFEGGIAAQDCDKPLARCLSHPPADSGLAERIFTCASVATPIWELNRICNFEPCEDVDAAARSEIDGGIVGRPCTTPRSRCIVGDKRILLCQPSGGLANAFNGYCDAGNGTSACNPAFDACAPTEGGVGGSTCAPERSRCIAGGDKLFVCAEH